MATDWQNQQPPRADRAEAALLGACLLTGAAIEDAINAGIQPHHFYHEHRDALWRAIRDQWLAGNPVDMVTICLLYTSPSPRD